MPESETIVLIAPGYHRIQSPVRKIECKAFCMTINQGYSYRHVMLADLDGQSLASYLATVFSHSNLANWQLRIEAAEITANERVLAGDELLKAGTILVWNRPGWVEEETPNEFQLLYEDEHLLAVSKPSGLPTLPGAGFYQNTLLSLVQAKFPKAKPVHRLGRATSGIVLFALHREAASRLSQQWPSVTKQYLALAAGMATESEYDIQSPIGQVEHPRLGSVWAASATGKPARSVARVLERRVDDTLFEVDLHTGRPHQIRIHFASIGHPLVGDPLYAAGGLPRAENPGLPGDAGYLLHAWRMRLNHPISGRQVEWEAAIPKALLKAQ